jgi:hypothetical protein
MEYKVIKKTRIDDNSEEKTIYQIKKKIFLDRWLYVTDADYIQVSAFINMFYGMFLTMIGLVHILTFSMQTYILLTIGFNLVINFILYKANKTIFKSARDAENEITKIIKKKNHVDKEEVVSLIKYEKNNLTIEK